MNIKLQTLKKLTLVVSHIFLFDVCEEIFNMKSEKILLYFCKNDKILKAIVFEYINKNNTIDLIKLSDPIYIQFYANYNQLRNLFPI